MEYLMWLQTIRTDFFDSVLAAVTDLVVSPLIYVIIAVVYWSFNKKAALFLAINVSVGTMVNQTLKNIFCVYRPWIKNPDIIPVESALENATGYSFPSGHSQIGSSVFLSVATLYKSKKWLVALCVFVTALVMFTRNYLGVHTPQDVIVGMLVAVAVIFINKKLLSWVDGGKNRDIFVAIAGVLLSVLALIYLTLKPYPVDFNADGSLLVDPEKMIEDCYVASGCMFGFFTGWILERRFVNFSVDISTKKRILRAVSGGIFMLLYAGLMREKMILMHHLWGEFAFFAIAFIFILFVFPWIFTKIERCC